MNKLFAAAKPTPQLHTEKKKAKVLVETSIKLLLETVIKKVSALSGINKSIYQKVGKFCTFSFVKHDVKIHCYLRVTLSLKTCIQELRN